MTTRRNFFRRLALGAAAFYVLPSATTYERVWRPTAVRSAGGLIVDPKVLRLTIRQLFNEQKSVRMYRLSEYVSEWMDRQGIPKGIQPLL